MDHSARAFASASDGDGAFRRWLWIGLLTGASVAFSLAFKCAAPFAAFAGLAALNMRRGDAVALVVSVWVVNQAIGFALLHYPHTPDTYVWAVAIGVAALFALAVAVCVDAAGRAGAGATTALAFGAAFIVYQAALCATSQLMGQGYAAFAPHVVLKMLAINGLALVGLLVLQRLALGLRLAAPRPLPHGLVAGT